MMPIPTLSARWLARPRKAVTGSALMAHLRRIQGRISSTRTRRPRIWPSSKTPLSFRPRDRGSRRDWKEPQGSQDRDPQGSRERHNRPSPAHLGLVWRVRRMLGGRPICLSP
jgi:hypothetical protein